MKLEESAKSWDTKMKQTIEEKERKVTSIVIDVIGLSNTVGRIMVRWVADRPWANTLCINKKTKT